MASQHSDRLWVAGLDCSPLLFLKALRFGTCIWISALVFFVLLWRSAYSGRKTCGNLAYPTIEYDAIMSTVHIITTARPDDVPLLPSIELAAARLLVGHAPESILGETTSQEELKHAQRQGLLWVALENEVPVGFAHVELLEPSIAHLKEIDVHPQYGRRGLGTRLIAAVCAWAAMAGCKAVTLTTFRDVAWNMPFYVRLGFHEIPFDELSPALMSVLRDEARKGLEPARRVAMERLCSLPSNVAYLKNFDDPR